MTPNTNIQPFKKRTGLEMEDKTTESLLASPLFSYLKTEWLSLEQKINTVQVQENDLLLYVLWVIDAWKDESTCVEMSSKLWDNVWHNLRSIFLSEKFTPSNDDMKTMTAIVCALSISCLGLMLSGSPENQDLYSRIVNQLGEHWKDVRSIKNELHHSDNQLELKGWLSGYFTSDIFYTSAEGLKWNTNVLSVSDKLLIPADTNSSMIIKGQNVAVQINGTTNINTFNNQSGATFVDNSISSTPEQ